MEEQKLQELMKRYAALVWKTAAAFLQDPEDMKECVNDVFLEYYLHSENYDPQKGSEAAYLAGIARKRAISMYRKNHAASAGRTRQGTKALSKEAAGPQTGQEDFEALEERIDLEAALSSLKPEDFDIIRLKYYDGMSIQEIADSLRLPYETVKKRHQRSISRLKLILILVMVLGIAALLTACVYTVLRHFGIIPGYGISYHETQNAYLLEYPVSAEDDFLRLEITDASLIGSTLTLDCRISFKTEIPESAQNTIASMQTTSLAYDGVPLNLCYRSAGQPEASVPITCQYDTDSLPEELPDSFSLLFTCSSKNSFEEFMNEHYPGYSWQSSFLEVSVPLTAISPENPDGYSYSMTERGGLLLMPRLENGELIVAIYPLDAGEGTIMPSLVKSLFCLEEAPVTAISEDGSVLTGQCIRYTPYSSDSYFEWNFGAALPGSYTLQVPYLLKTYNLEKTLSFSFHLESLQTSETVCRLPNADLTLTSMEPYTPEGQYLDGLSSSAVNPDTSYFLMHLQTDMDQPDEKLLWLYLLAPGYEIRTDGGLSNGIAITRQNHIASDQLTFILSVENTVFQLYSDALSDCRLELSSPDSMHGYNVVYQWNHSFSIPFTVEEEKTE